MARARIGVMGTGWWATEAHMPGVLSHRDTGLVAVCDTDPVRLAAAAQAYGVGRTYNKQPTTRRCSTGSRSTQ